MEMLIVWLLAAPVFAVAFYIVFPRRSTVVALSFCPLLAGAVFVALFWSGGTLRGFLANLGLIAVKGSPVGALAWALATAASFVLRRQNAWLAWAGAMAAAWFGCSHGILHLTRSDIAAGMLILPFAVLGKYTPDAFGRTRKKS